MNGGVIGGYQADTRKGRLLTHTHTQTALYYKLAQIGEAKVCLLRKSEQKNIIANNGKGKEAMTEEGIITSLQSR